MLLVEKFYVVNQYDYSLLMRNFPWLNVNGELGTIVFEIHLIEMISNGSFRWKIVAYSIKTSLLERSNTYLINIHPHIKDVIYVTSSHIN